MAKLNKIATAADLRAVLLASIEAVLEGRLNTSQAQAVSSLSTEVHKSLRQEWDMRVYANENLHLEAGEVVKMLEAE